MKRFVSYLYSIYNNQKIHNAGFARMELRAGRNRIEIHMRENGYSGKTGTVYLFIRSKENIQGISIGTITFRNNQADFRYEQAEENIGQTSWQIMQMNGILIMIDDQAAFLSQWDEQPVDTSKFTVWSADDSESEKDGKDEQEAGQKPQTITETNKNAVSSSNTAQNQNTVTNQKAVPDSGKASKQNTEQNLNDSLNPNARSNQSVRLNQNMRSNQNVRLNQNMPLNQNTSLNQNASLNQNVLSNQNMSAKQNTSLEQYTDSETHLTEGKNDISTQTDTHTDKLPENEQTSSEESSNEQVLNEQLSDIQTAELQPQPENKWMQTWRNMLRMYPVINQFKENDHVLCVRIEIKDVRLLPEKYWSMVNNSFLLHGFFNYRYLIFGRIGENWFIGIPGIYQNQEHAMASIFGFPDFLPQAQKSAQGEQLGYWYRVLEI